MPLRTASRSALEQRLIVVRRHLADLDAPDQPPARTFVRRVQHARLVRTQTDLLRRLSVPPDGDGD